MVSIMNLTPGDPHSVSHSDVGRVARYIANQEEHHRKRTYSEEYEMFVKRYGLEWRSEENH